jgi:hypothetical protein
MCQPDDPFTGEWTFNAERSDLSSPAPKKWLQQILATPDEVHVREEITNLDGSLRVVWVKAEFDGMDYPVTGSPVADVIAYTLLDDNNISGIAKKNDGFSLRETLSAAPSGETLTYIFRLRRAAEGGSRCRRF